MIHSPLDIDPIVQMEQEKIKSKQRKKLYLNIFYLFFYGIFQFESNWRVFTEFPYDPIIKYGAYWSTCIFWYTLIKLGYKLIKK